MGRVLVIKSIIEGLYYGDLSAFSRKVTPNQQHTIDLQNLEKTRRYFEEKLSADDCERLKSLDTYYDRVCEFKATDSFGYGLRLGVMLMCEIFLFGESTPLDSEE